MTTMVAELYDALMDAGASDDKARKAAEALTSYDSRFDRVERRIDAVERRIDALEHKIELGFAVVERKIDGAVTPLKADNAVLKWMVGAVFAAIIPILLKLFFH